MEILVGILFVIVLVLAIFLYETRQYLIKLQENQKEINQSIIDYTNQQNDLNQTFHQGIKTALRY